jgi:hypothetical protein
MMSNKSMLICCKLGRTTNNELQVTEYSVDSDILLKELTNLQELMDKGKFDEAIYLYATYLRESTQSLIRS